jgi:hypothetical protein
MALAPLGLTNHEIAQRLVVSPPPRRPREPVDGEAPRAALVDVLLAS